MLLLKTRKSKKTEGFAIMMAFACYLTTYGDDVGDSRRGKARHRRRTGQSKHTYKVSAARAGPDGAGANIGDGCTLPKKLHLFQFSVIYTTPKEV